MANESMNFKKKLFFLAFETVIGAGAHAGTGLEADDAFLFRDGSYEVDEQIETPEYDDGNSRFAEEVIDRRWKMGGNCYLQWPETPGVVGSQNSLFLICGWDVVADATAKTITYTPSSLDAIDTGHIGFQRKKKTGDALFYESKAVRGTFGIKVKINEKIDFTSISLEGSYEQPSEQAAIAGNVSAQKARLARSVKPSDITTWVGDGEELCAQEFDINSIPGIELKKGSLRCDGETEATEITPTGSVTYKQTDLANKNPWPEKGANSDPGSPFTFEVSVAGKGKFRIHNTLVQMGTPKDVADDKGNLAIQRSLRFLGDFTITFSEAV